MVIHDREPRVSTAEIGAAVSDRCGGVTWCREDITDRTRSGADKCERVRTCACSHDCVRRCANARELDQGFANVGGMA